MTSKATVIYFDEKMVERDYYKNSHLCFGYDEYNNPILIFMIPSSGNTPAIPFGNDSKDQHRMMDVAFDNLIDNPTLETTIEFLNRVPSVHVQRIYNFKDSNDNEELLKLYQERLTDGIITKIGYQMFN